MGRRCTKEEADRHPLSSWFIFIDGRIQWMTTAKPVVTYRTVLAPAR